MLARSIKNITVRSCSYIPLSRSVRVMSSYIPEETKEQINKLKNQRKDSLEFLPYPLITGILTLPMSGMLFLITKEFYCMDSSILRHVFFVAPMGMGGVIFFGASVYNVYLVGSALKQFYKQTMQLNKIYEEIKQKEQKILAQIRNDKEEKQNKMEQQNNVLRDFDYDTRN